MKVIAVHFLGDPPSAFCADCFNGKPITEAIEEFGDYTPTTEPEAEAEPLPAPSEPLAPISPNTESASAPRQARSVEKSLHRIRLIRSKRLPAKNHPSVTSSNFRRGDPLSIRECEILMFIARGVHKSKEIAAALEITERTVKFHIGSAFEKSGAKDRIGLLLWWQQTAGQQGANSLAIRALRARSGKFAPQCAKKFLCSGGRSTE